MNSSAIGQDHNSFKLVSSDKFRSTRPANFKSVISPIKKKKRRTVVRRSACASGTKKMQIEIHRGKDSSTEKIVVIV